MLAKTDTTRPDGLAETRVRRIFREALELDVDLHTELIETGVLDSTAFVQLLLALEGEFGVEVDVATLDLEDFGSVARIARFVSSNGSHR